MSDTHSDTERRHERGPFKTEREGAVVQLVIDRPWVGNALGADDCRALAAQVDTLGADRSVRVIVLRGAGEHFCAGADLSGLRDDLERRDEQLLNRIRYGYHTVIEALARCATPTLAVIRGACLGFGLDLALACDLRLVASDAQLAQGCDRVGLVASGGSSYTLPRLVGLARALELQLLGESLSGEEAAAMGLVNRALAPAELDAFAARWAKLLASGPAIAQRLAKANLRAGATGGTLVEALEREAKAQLECLRSKDLRRGLAAFYAKGEPSFEGR